MQEDLDELIPPELVEQINEAIADPQGPFTRGMLLRFARGIQNRKLRRRFKEVVRAAEFQGDDLQLGLINGEAIAALLTQSGLESVIPSLQQARADLITGDDCGAILESAIAEGVATGDIIKSGDFLQAAPAPGEEMPEPLKHPEWEITIAMLSMAIEEYGRDINDVVGEEIWGPARTTSILLGEFLERNPNPTAEEVDTFLRESCGIQLHKTENEGWHHNFGDFTVARGMFPGNFVLTVLPPGHQIARHKHRSPHADIPGEFMTPIHGSVQFQAHGAEGQCEQETLSQTPERDVVYWLLAGSTHEFEPQEGLWIGFIAQTVRSQSV